MRGKPTYLFVLVFFAMFSCRSVADKSENHAMGAEKKSDTMNTVNSFEMYTADYVEIRQLIDAYNDMVNGRRWQLISDIFTEDAVWKALPPITMTWDGLADIQVKLPTSVERMAILIQSSSGVVIHVENSSFATARSLLTEFGRNKETGAGMHSVASYEDTFLKKDNKWRIKTRKLTLLYNDTLPVPGNVEDYKY